MGCRAFIRSCLGDGNGPAGGDAADAVDDVNDSIDNDNSTVSDMTSLWTVEELDLSIDADYVAKLPIMKRATCRFCGKQSTDLNPIIRDVKYCRSKKYPCLIWQNGDHLKPKGRFCRCCNFAFQLGGFASEYDDMTACAEAAMNKPQILLEIQACTRELIVLTNNGKVTMKVRGKKRGQIERNLKEKREAAVKAFKKTSVVADLDMATLPLAEWKEKNPGKVPEEHGKIAMVYLPDKMQEVECLTWRTSEYYSLKVRIHQHFRMPFIMQ